MIEFDKIIDFLSLNELKSNYKKLNNELEQTTHVVLCT